jgi:hypothetical protein
MPTLAMAFAWEEIMPKFIPLARHGAGVFAMLAGFAIVTAPIDQGLAQRPTAPVEVENTTTNPVPVDVLNPATQPVPVQVLNNPTTNNNDDPGRGAYLSVSLPSNCHGSSTCLFNFNKLPLGKRLVVLHASGQLTFTGNPLFVQADLDEANHFFAPFIVNPDSKSNGPGFIRFNESVLAYYNSTPPQVQAPPQVQIVLFGTGAPAFDAQVGTVTLAGYLLDCMASPCAPIAQ